MKPKQLKMLGKELTKVKTWEKATSIGSKVLNTAGDVTMIAGTVTGQPEVVAFGGGLKGAGVATGKVNKILKQY
jgi:hypothetical protein